MQARRRVRVPRRTHVLLPRQPRPDRRRGPHREAGARPPGSVALRPTVQGGRPEWQARQGARCLLHVVDFGQRRDLEDAPPGQQGRRPRRVLRPQGAAEVRDVLRQLHGRRLEPPERSAGPVPHLFRARGALHASAVHGGSRHENAGRRGVALGEAGPAPSRGWSGLQLPAAGHEPGHGAADLHCLKDLANVRRTASGARPERRRPRGGPI
mmetsp:Transcript_85592/g.184755  ORF Transcript_85592/g.184755 Transcript_85592/m.184755 type:complete len:211 (-) Transcript_85592:7-639(-)